VLKQDAGLSATATHYVYDIAGRLIAESDATGSVTRAYIDLAGLPLAIVADQLAVFLDDLGFVHADHLRLWVVCRATVVLMF
jgi:YD repeat-containing protein